MFPPVPSICTVVKDCMFDRGEREKRKSFQGCGVLPDNVRAVGDNCSII